jgi:type I pantothenate kinase
MGLADYFDFSIYVDARTADIERWYLGRFSELRQTAFTDPDSYFRRFAELPEHEALEQARSFWTRINLPNLLENVAPTRRRATLVLRKGANHSIERVWLRKL